MAGPPGPAGPGEDDDDHDDYDNVDDNDQEVERAGLGRRGVKEREDCCPRCLEISPPPYWRDLPALLASGERQAWWGSQGCRASRGGTGSMASRD